MKINFKILLCLPAFLLLHAHGFAQKKGEKIELVQAEELEGGKVNNEPVRKLRGNVIFKQGDAIMYCDSAYQYTKRNGIDAFGNVRINQGDSIQLTGNKLYYNGDNRRAKVRENVMLKDPKMTLTTEALDYDLNTKVANYNNGGTIIDGNTTLISKQGFYNTKSKVFRFRKDVKVDNPTENFKLESDTLHYNTNTKIATFFGPSKITSAGDVMYANEGTYNTVTAQYDFAKQAQVRTEEYTIFGDKIHHDEKKDVTIIAGNVKLMSPKDSIIVESDHAQYWGKSGYSKVYGNVLMKQYSEGDTLFLTSDTLISIDSKEKPEEKRLLAFPKAKIFRTDLQAIADSLVYNFGDSTIYFYHDPVLWSETSQLTSDSVRLEMMNNNPHKMYMNNNSFIVSQDTLLNFNQVKGRDMTGFFKERKMDRMLVNGNAESFYYALEDERKVMGVNKSLCSDMLIKFADTKVHTISFLAEPKSKFIPPHELDQGEAKLGGFKWRIEERPSYESVTEVRKASLKVPVVYEPGEQSGSEGEAENGTEDKGEEEEGENAEGKDENEASAKPSDEEQKEPKKKLSKEEKQQLTKEEKKELRKEQKEKKKKEKIAKRKAKRLLKMEKEYQKKKNAQTN
ncbi:MAG: OstA-like protein [Cytophagaceae bacterium]